MFFMKPLLYLAAAGTEPIYANILKEKFNVIHPGYQFNPAEFPNAPSSKNHFENALLKDFYGVKIADVIVFDVDSQPGDHYLAWAFSLNKPVLAVSENLIIPNPYWSAAIEFLVKPEQALGHALVINKELSEKILAEERRNQEIINARATQPPQEGGHE